MIGTIWWAIGLAAGSFLAYRAGRVWIDAGRHGLEPVDRLGWALLGAISPALYWWGRRIEALSSDEQGDLLARETESLSLGQADSLRCPLCKAEVPHAWALTAAGQPTVAPGPVECPRCDFRLDACRHCVHFLPGSPQSWGQSPWHAADITFGRCHHYQTYQPVEQACAPDMAHRLKARGYERVRASAPIIDSFLPLRSCIAFKPQRRRLRASRIHWPDARRIALLKLLNPPPATRATPAGELTGRRTVAALSRRADTARREA